MTRRIWHCIKSQLRPYSTHPFIIESIATPPPPIHPQTRCLSTTGLFQAVPISRLSRVKFQCNDEARSWIPESTTWRHTLATMLRFSIGPKIWVNDKALGFDKNIKALCSDEGIYSDERLPQYSIQCSTMRRKQFTTPTCRFAPRELIHNLRQSQTQKQLSPRICCW